MNVFGTIKITCKEEKQQQQKTLVFPMANDDLLNPELGGDSLYMHFFKKKQTTKKTNKTCFN